MLQKLLAEIEKGGTLNPTLLAARLQTSPELVAMMLEDLERRGKLTRLSTDCGTAAVCGGCPVATTCTPGSQSQARVWLLSTTQSGASAQR
jgi:hypothetical protein